MIKEFSKISKISGELSLPGDKSISHRAVMFACLAKGQSEISNLLESEDVISTMNCFRMLGCSIEKIKDKYIIIGNGFYGLREANDNLYCGNSGTTARLISGILSVQKFKSILTGDQSLSNRPMLRVIEPLKKMGCSISASYQNTMPIRIFPSQNLYPINYEMPVPSAQVKSAILLAGLHLEESTTVIEELPTRDHTERMLDLPIEKVNERTQISVSKKYYPSAKEYFVPSDISSAAFFIVLALIKPNSELLLKNVLLNETRCGVIDVLTSMGGNIKIVNKKYSGSEKYGDIIAKSSELRNIEIDKRLIPNIIDEIPVLSIAGLFAEDSFRINGAAELRFKETDRIKAMSENFKKLGLDVEEFDDGFEVGGRVKVHDAVIESYNDHRIAMSFSILALAEYHNLRINNAGCIAISNPKFFEQLNQVSI